MAADETMVDALLDDAEERMNKWRVAILFRDDVYRAVSAFADTEEAGSLSGERLRLLEHWLRELVSREAADLFLVAGFAPAIRLNGVVTPMDAKDITGGRRKFDAGARTATAPFGEALVRLGARDGQVVGRSLALTDDRADLQVGPHGRHEGEGLGCRSPLRRRRDVHARVARPALVDLRQRVLRFLLRPAVIGLPGG